MAIFALLLAATAGPSGAWRILLRLLLLLLLEPVPAVLPGLLLVAAPGRGGGEVVVADVRAGSPKEAHGGCWCVGGWVI